MRHLLNERGGKELECKITLLLLSMDARKGDVTGVCDVCNATISIIVNIPIVGFPNDVNYIL